MHVGSDTADEEARKAAAESEGVDARDLPGTALPVPVVQQATFSAPEIQDATTQGSQESRGKAGSASHPIEIDEEPEPVEDIKLSRAAGGTSGASNTSRKAHLASSRPAESFPPALIDTAREAGPSAGTTLNALPRPKQDPTQRRRVSPVATTRKTSPTASPTWSCPVCTLINSDSVKRCDACSAPQPRDDARGWWCDVCLEFGNAHDRWMCLSCGSIKRVG